MSPDANKSRNARRHTDRPKHSTNWFYRFVGTVYVLFIMAVITVFVAAYYHGVSF